MCTNQKEVIAILYQRILNESQRLKEQINAIQHQIKELPDGNLICTRDGKYHKWYQSDGHTQTYIPKKNRQLAEQLAAKKYLSLLSEDLLHEKKALDFYLRHHSSTPNQADSLLANNPEYQELLMPLFTPLSQELLNWQNAPYITNPNYSAQLSIKTCSKNLVRSKSEALIDMALFTKGIPFRYECALQLNNITLYPDFTIRHPQTGKTYYWEHFGLMDKPAYCEKVSSKLQLYISNGIIPSIDLITTYETKENPLSPETVERIIEFYF